MKKKYLLLLCICLLISGCASKNKIQNNSKDIVDRYNMYNITYEQAITELDNMLADANTDEKRSIIEDGRNEIDELKVSKDSFEKAEKAFDDEKYADAISAYSEVIEKDSNYDIAQDKLDESKNDYLKAVYEQADIYLESNKYDKAIELYNNAKEIVDSDELDKKISEAEAAQQTYLDNQIAEMEKTAEQYVEDKDYINALKEYKSLYEITEDEKYDVKIDGVKDAMVDYAIENAEALLSEGKYDEAKSALSQAKYNVPDDERISDEEDRIEYFRPVSINELDSLYGEAYSEPTYLFQTEGSWYLYPWESGDIDNLGRSGFSGAACGDPDLKTKNQYGNTYAFLEYMIDGQYDSLQGEFALSQDTKNTDLSARLYIYIVMMCLFILRKL
ncbi:MAG: hypothetical protein IJ167_01010 [Lachnospiraceae bacterium]|nr:hypothetical protein [Lachnospiraceae bacterium]